MDEKKTALERLTETEPDSVSGGRNIKTPIRIQKRHELFVCPRGDCAGKLVFSKRTEGSAVLFTMRCTNCSWSADCAKDEDPQRVWNRAHRSL